MAAKGDSKHKRLIKAIAGRVSGKKGAPGYLTALASDLFARVGLEALEAYSTAELSGFVRLAAETLGRRPAGKAVVRLINPTFSGASKRHRDVTLIEIVNTNMPFIVDSVLAELQQSGADILLVAHPIVAVERDARGALRRYHGTDLPPSEGSFRRESLMQIHIARIADEKERHALAERLTGVLGNVRDAVTDWPTMCERLSLAIDDYRKTPPPLASAEVHEAVAFLEWLLADNFTLLGMREYDFVGGGRRGELRRKDQRGLGILNDPEIRILSRGGEAFTTSSAVRAFLLGPEPLIITKANIKSVVHRRAYMDYVGVKLYRADGRVAGELRVLGLFTSTAYNSSTTQIPYLRRKVADILLKAGYDVESHSGKALVNLLESYPRDELFQIDEETLFDFARDIIDLGERPRIRALVRPDKFDRFVSVIVFIPRDRYNSDVRERTGAYLAEAFDGHVSAYYPTFPEAMMLARVHFIIGRSRGKTPVRARAELEAGIAAIARTWTDSLRYRLLNETDAHQGARLAEQFANAFPLAYRDDFSPDVAVTDLETAGQLTPDRPIAIRFEEKRADGDHVAGLKLVHLATPIALSERVPVLEAMGFRVIDERSYEIQPGDSAAAFHVHDMRIEVADRSGVDLNALAEPLTDCLSAVWYGQTEDDGFNALVLKAGLSWREAALIRAIARFIRQAGTPYTQSYMWSALARHAAFARDLVALFRATFDPDNPDDEAATAAIAAIETGLEQVESLDDDTIIRRFLSVVQAMLRTNFFQCDADGTARQEITFKLDSRKIDGLPEPRPFREIFVHSPRLEGVHLRFGPVARGGLRWSDRPLDFRTEILGLVKAQQVKNAVIVPVGAKGGFVPQRLPEGGSREKILAEGTAAYRIFISSLLDLTDNLDGDRVVPPPEVVRRDGDDSYLVVAADKGTASFSDIANGIAEERGFWLGDAFASGGSAGYDHKKMGITARGAWEAVKRHFREMDVDIQTTPFTVIGVGDMSGDVFGNGMLLSPAIKLVAAFDHRDIFIDPDPKPAAALAERRRLFKRQRSSWQDYDPAKLSAGGGVFSRKQKSIRLTREIKALLDVTVDRLTPSALIRAILKAKADLLWFGGIGTYVRAGDERDADVGDRSNDAVRVSARDLRVSVAGEGANLGMTQRARIEFGLAGGRCNSDAIDNSAGVNTSDVEVNIKIALARAMRGGKLTLARRDRLLKAMTDDVAELVLANNYRQTLAISLTERRGFEDFPFQLRMMQDMEASRVLDREVEILPDDVAMAERQSAGNPLTRAEIGVLLAYAKIDLFDAIIASDVIDDPVLARVLMSYFPNLMRKDFADEIRSHRLAREIVATELANAVINRGGPAFVTRASDRTGAAPAAIVRAFVAVREAYALREVNADIDVLDNRVPGAVQLSLYDAVQNLHVGRTVWFVRHASFAEGIGPVVETYGRAVSEIGRDLMVILPQRLSERVAARTAELEEVGVPQVLASRIAGLGVLASVPEIHLAASESGRPLAEAAKVYFEAAEAMGVDRLAALAVGMRVTDYYDGLALDRAIDVLATAHRRIVIGALSAADEVDPLSEWLDARRVAADHALRAIAAMTAGEELTVSRVSVAANLLADLAGHQ